LTSRPELGHSLTPQRDSVRESMASSKGGAFGAPKPLVGQKGFSRERESTSLENETQMMSDRLASLREQMMREKELRDISATKKVGGVKWRSARTDKSVRSYAKEVKNKYQQKVEAARQIPQSKPREKRDVERSREAESSSRALPEPLFSAPPASGGGGGCGALRSGPAVQSWGVGEVVAWLGELGLQENYGAVFEANEISGPILLEVGLDDLDYMEVRALGHRKLLLKGIADLKKHGRPTLDLKASHTRPPMAPSPRAAPSSVASSAAIAAAVEAEAKTAAGPPPRVHWSQVAPLAETEVAGDDSAAESVNLADGMYDEAAAAREFQEAVAAWRTGGSAASAPPEGRAESASGGAFDPAAGATSAADFGFGPETAEPGAGLASTGGGGEWTNPWAERPAHHHPNTATLKKGSSNTAGASSLLDGDYDEAARAREFQEAVAAWRTGGSAPIGGGGATNSSGAQSGGPARASAAAVAEALAKELDKDFKQDADKFAEERKVLESRMEAQRSELAAKVAAERAKVEALVKEQTEAEAKGQEEDDLSGEDLDGMDDFGSLEDEVSPTGQKSDENNPVLWLEGVGGGEVGQGGGMETWRSQVDIAVVETTLGYTPRGENGPGEEDELEQGYVVIEESDDEDN